MGCNCGGPAAAKKKYIYTDGNGRQHTYNTEIEAQAAKIRDQKRGSIRAEAR